MMALNQTQSRGAGLIEILVTIAILMVGLLGLVRLQGVATVSQTEAYQRSQALVLLKDMAGRINANRQNAMAYVTDNNFLGAGNAGQTTNCAALAGKDLDFCQWQRGLLGSAETNNGNAVGAMLSARGCIYNIDPVEPRKFLIAVAWQGLQETVTNGDVDCGNGDGVYGTGDNLRRLVTLTLTVGKLD